MDAGNKFSMTVELAVLRLGTIADLRQSRGLTSDGFGYADPLAGRGDRCASARTWPRFAPTQKAAGLPPRLFVSA